MVRKICVVVLLLVVVLNIFTKCSSPISPTASPSPSSELTPSSEPAPISEPPATSGVELIPPDKRVEYPEGIYEIGADMPAGIYFAIANGGVAMASVTVKDGAGTDATPLAVDTFQSGHTMIAVDDGQHLSVIGCTLIDAGFTATCLSNVEGVPEGMYLVGFHFPAGEYKTVVDDGAVPASLTVYKDASHQTPGNVQIVNGSGYITLKDGEYVRLLGVHLES